MKIRIRSLKISAAAVALLSLSLAWPTAADEDEAPETVLTLSPGGATLEGAESIVESYGGAYSADAIVIQGNVYNFADLDGVSTIGRIDGSFNGIEGIAQVNQSVGTFENQANVVSLAVGGSAEGVLGDLSAAVGVIYKDNKVNVTDAVLGSHIKDSFNNMSGIAQVNQSSGGVNNQHNVLVVGVDLEGAAEFIALSDDALAVHSGGNEVEVDGDFEPKVTRTNSFNNFSGIAQVNQVAGFGNTTGQTMAVSVNTINIP